MIFVASLVQSFAGWEKKYDFNSISQMNVYRSNIKHVYDNLLAFDPAVTLFSILPGRGVLVL